MCHPLGCISFVSGEGPLTNQLPVTFTSFDKAEQWLCQYRKQLPEISNFKLDFEVIWRNANIDDGGLKYTGTMVVCHPGLKSMAEIYPQGLAQHILSELKRIQKSDSDYPIAKTLLQGDYAGIQAVLEA